MKSKKTFIACSIFLFSIFLFNCGGGGSSSDNTVTSPGGNTTDPIFTIENVEGLSFVLKLFNFPAIKYIQFRVNYNSSQLTYSGSTQASTGAPFFEQSDSSGIYMSFIPPTPISGNIDIIHLNFSGSNYNNTKIKIDQLYIEDINGTDITGEISYGTICYLDKGIIDQAYNNTSEPLKNWTPSGIFVWDYTFCAYIE
jgi:hypothetical protein